MKSIFEKMALYDHNETFMTKEFADNLMAFCNGLDFVEYPYRGKKLKRSPKAEFRKNDKVGPYR